MFPIRSSQSQKNSYQRIPTLRTQLCNAERLCQISPKANEPYAVISLEDQKSTACIHGCESKGWRLVALCNRSLFANIDKGK